MSRITTTTWKFRVQYKPKGQPAKDRSYQEYTSPEAVGDKETADRQCAAKVAELTQDGFKIVEKSVWSSSKTTGTDDRALIVGHFPNDLIAMDETVRGNTWEDVARKVASSIHTVFYCREDVAYCDIFHILPEGIVYIERQNYPEYMRVYREIVALCKANFKPADYYLTQRTPGKFTLQVYNGHGNDFPFQETPLDAAALPDVAQYFADRADALAREEQAAVTMALEERTA